MPEKCLIRWCKSGLDGTVPVNENIGDQSYRTEICINCATALGIKEGDDLPDANVVERTLKTPPRSKKKDDDDGDDE